MTTIVVAIISIAAREPMIIRAISLALARAFVSDESEYVIHY